MTGIGASLNIAKNAIAVQQYGISVVGHNISNVNTSDYSRQSIELSATSPISSAGVIFGTGVDVQDVSQVADQLLSSRLADAQSDFSAADQVESYMTIMETLFDEESENSLSNLISDFWNSWEDLADNPEGSAEKSIITEKGAALATTFDSLSTSLADMGNEITQKLETSVAEINSIASELAQLNKDIVAAEAGGASANDLIDKRAALVTNLSELIDVQSYEQKNGALTVTTANGCALVDEFEVRSLKCSEGQILWMGSSSGTVDITDKISGGEIGGLLDVRDEVLPKYSAELDELADQMIWAVNYIHSQGVGESFFSTELEGTYSTGDSGLLSTLAYGDQIDYSKTFKMWIEDSGTSPADLSAVEIDLSISSVSAELVGSGDPSAKYSFTVVTGGEVGSVSDPPEILWEQLNADGDVIDSGTFLADTVGTNPPAPGFDGTLMLDLGAGTLVAGNTFTVNTDDTGAPDPLLFSPDGSANSVNDTYTFKVVSGGKVGTAPVDGSEPITIEWSNGITSGTFVLNGTNPPVVPPITETVTVDGMQLTFANGTVFEDDVFVITTDENGRAVELPADTSDPVTTPGYLPSDWQWTLDSFADQFNEHAYGLGIQASVTSDNTLQFSQKVNGYEPVNFNYSGKNGFIADNTEITISNYDAMTIATQENVPIRLDWDGTTSTWTLSGDPGYAAPGIQILSGSDSQIELDFDNDGLADMTVDFDDAVVNQGWIEFEIKPDELGDYRFAFSDDAHEDSGLTAALGLNTFFTGQDADTIDVNDVLDELGFVAAAQIDGVSGLYASGDNTNAMAIGERRYTIFELKEWNFERGSEGSSSLIEGTVEDYCHNMIGEIGIDAQNIIRDKASMEAIVNQVTEQREALSGVSLDEEMINLVKYQQAYTAAAKLLTTLDEMLDTLLNIT